MKYSSKQSLNKSPYKKPGRFSTPSSSIKLDKLNYDRRILFSGFFFSLLVHFVLVVVFIENPFSWREEVKETGQEVGIIYLKKISPRPSMTFEYNINKHSLNHRISGIKKDSKPDSALFAKEEITRVFDYLNGRGSSGDNHGFSNELYLIEVKYVALYDRWGNPVINPPRLKDE